MNLNPLDTPTVVVLSPAVIIVISALCSVIIAMFFILLKDKKHAQRTIISMATNMAKVAADSSTAIDNSNTITIATNERIGHQINLLIEVRTLLQSIYRKP